MPRLMTAYAAGGCSHDRDGNNLCPSVRRDELWARLKGYRVADAVIEAGCCVYPIMGVFAQRPSCVARHEGGYAKIPVLAAMAQNEV